MLSNKSKYEKYKPKKRFGQNFLVDDNIARKIVKSLDIVEHDTVIEIGPGQGALTKHLIAEAKRFLAVEIDIKAAEELKNKGYNVIIKDFLQFDLEEDIPQEFRGGEIKFIGNIPYNITSGILFKLLDSKVKIKSCVMMIQKEVAERLVAKVNTKQYGILAVQFQAIANVKQLFNVLPTAFFPKPDVVSSVIRITFGDNEIKISNISVFKEFVRSAFSKRRKTLKNSLKDFFEKYELNINDYQFDFTRRAESLTIKEFADFSNILTDKIKLS
ncbi:MAG: 16S rRNA (adenine(1518)-N(6)/adenine(1519)-N(6))-dimethyltransferase RsmA [Candidatus Kapaibacterium sp.]